MWNHWQEWVLIVCSKVKTLVDCYLTHWGWDKMAAMSQMTFSNVIFLNENVRISIKISLKFVRMGPINNIPPLVQIRARRRPGYKPLSEPMVCSLPTHICSTRPQWVKDYVKAWYCQSSLQDIGYMMQQVCRNDGDRLEWALEVI